MAFADILQVPSLGAVHKLGDFYDARKDTFVNSNIFTSYPEGDEIISMETNKSELGFIPSDDITEKLKCMDVSGDMSLSVLYGIVALAGSGRYLIESKESRRAQRSTLLYSIKTISEQVFLLNLRNKIDFDILDSVYATHVVIGVDWGARYNISLEHENKERLEEEEVIDLLEAELNKFRRIVDVDSAEQTKGRIEGIDTDEEVNYYMLCDISRTKQAVPSTFETARELVNNFPLLVRGTNEGKGVPIAYMLLPIDSAAKLLKRKRELNLVVKHVNKELIEKNIDFIKRTLFLKQELRDLKIDITGKEDYVADDMEEKINHLIKQFTFEEKKMKLELAEMLVQIRSGAENPLRIEEIIEKYERSGSEFSNIKSHIVKEKPIFDKLRRIDEWKKKFISYLGKHEMLQEVLSKEPTRQCYVLRLPVESCEIDATSRISNIKYFLRLNKTYREHSNVKFVVADCDIKHFPGTTKSTILLYENGKLCCKDVTKREAGDHGDNCQVQFTITKPIGHKSINRSLLELPCPNYFKGSCQSDIKRWNCVKCKQLIDYGLDDKYFYCKCGQSSSTLFDNAFSYQVNNATNPNIQFRCNDVEHGATFVPFPEKELDEWLSKLQIYKELSILVLGETGVGKSTWINAVANYFWFQTLEDATKEDFFTLIQSKFTFTDNDGETREISVGEEDRNESLITGQSVTQEPTSYSIYIPKDKMVIRLIDTPGIGDTRGVDQDKKNFENILSHLCYHKEINGICVLLKPNESRLTTLFRFCINELLTHLHRSAAQNIVFCFTNARATMYRPGETKATLQKLIEANKDIGIRLSKETCYCFDNEAFRFLACLKNGVEFSSNEIKDYGSSWETAAAETHRLIKRISFLQPHCTQETLSLNHARKVILTLSKPLAEISQTILKNILEAEDKKKELAATKKSKSELQAQMVLNGIDLEIVQLSYPMTVCTHASCIEHISVGNSNQQKTWYKQQCHPHCYLSGIPTGVVNNPLLKGCAAMSGQENCQQCGHSWIKHMHLTYDMKEVPITFIDKNKEKLVNEKITDEQKILEFTKDIDVFISQQRQEQIAITNISAQFGCFLKMNALTPFNDAIEDHIQHLISVESEKRKPDYNLVGSLQKMQACYREQNKIITSAVMGSVAVNVKTISCPGDVELRRHDLFKLKINGPRIEKLFKDIDQQNSRISCYRHRQFAPSTTRRRNSRTRGSTIQKSSSWKKWVPLISWT